MTVIQNDLDRVAQNWNLHNIRAKKKDGLQGGKPDKMFFLPDEFGVQSYECECDEGEVSNLMEEMERNGGVPSMIDNDFVRFVSQLVPDWDEATTVGEGEELYALLSNAIAEFERNM